MTRYMGQACNPKFGAGGGSGNPPFEWVTGDLIGETRTSNRACLKVGSVIRLVWADSLTPVEDKPTPVQAPADARVMFADGGVRDGAEKTERFELIWTEDDAYEDQMLTRYAAWMARGAKKYEDRNWEAFRGADSLAHAVGSLLRHVFKFVAGNDDEDHAAAIWFNVHAIDRIRRKMKG